MFLKRLLRSPFRKGSVVIAEVGMMLSDLTEGLDLCVGKNIFNASEASQSHEGMAAHKQVLVYCCCLDR